MEVIPSIEGRSKFVSMRRTPNLHYHLIVIEGVFVDRTEQNLKPHFIKVEPPNDVEVAEVVRKISCRASCVISTWPLPQHRLRPPTFAKRYSPSTKPASAWAHRRGARRQQCLSPLGALKRRLTPPLRFFKPVLPSPSTPEMPVNAIISNSIRHLHTARSRRDVQGAFPGLRVLEGRH